MLSWAPDNVLTRPCADLDPVVVVRVKAFCGVVLTGALARLLREPRPTWAPLGGLLVCGATGYGVSLRLYLLAQRHVGAGRTGSLFALAPFMGALVAILLGDKSLGALMLAATALFVAGVALHLTEAHHHAPAHTALDHDHAHDHHDGHRDYWHEAMPVGPHAHPHHHVARVHAHPHGPDTHHGHEH